MNDKLITISSVRGRLDDKGNPELNLEDVARGLGFTRVATSGNKVVRWERVRGYLDSFGVPTCGHDEKSPLVGKDGLPDFIAENIFYKLCFKAENATAQRFQDTVTDEVLPAIRKHGGYLTPDKIEEVLLNPDTIIQLATQLKAEKEQRTLLETRIKEQRPKVIFADAVSVSHTSILVGELAKLLKQNNVDIGQNRLFQWLRDNGYLIRRKGTDYNMPTQYSMERELFEIKETVITHSDGHTSTNKTPKVTGKGQIYFINKFKEQASA